VNWYWTWPVATLLQSLLAIANGTSILPLPVGHAAFRYRWRLVTPRVTRLRKGITAGQSSHRLAVGQDCHLVTGPSPRSTRVSTQ
jgi:hypothetical protein